MEEKRILGLMLIQTFIALSLGLIGPIYALYFEKLSNYIYLVPVLIGIYWIFVGILEPIFGKYIDIIGKKRSFIIGCIATSFAIILYPLANNVSIIIIAQIIAAIGYSLETPSYYSLIAELTNKKRRGVEIGKVDGIGNIIYGLSALLSAAFLYYTNFEILFFISSFLYLLAGIFAVRLIEDI
ncbi:MAG: MFS transporter [Candidatus Aenigmatarchaeota archaeon]